MKKLLTTFLLLFLIAVSLGYSQTPQELQENTLKYVQRAADGDHLALEGGHLALDGHVMPYPFFEAHEILYLYRLSQLRHKKIFSIDSIYYKAGWDQEIKYRSEIPKSAFKISANQLNGGRLTHESYWFNLPKLPNNKTGHERFFTLKPIEMSLPGWPETTIYINGESKAALMRQHFYWSLDELLNDNESHLICLKSFGIYNQPRGYKEISIVERDPDIDELYWYMRVLIEAESILNPNDKGAAEIKVLADEVMSKLDLDIAETSLFKSQLQNYLPELRSRFERITSLSNSSFTLKMLNHGHLDSAWRWTLNHTDEKIERLVLNNLYLMDRYPEYKYIFTTPYHYERLSALYPELFARVKEKIKNGQWVADGSTYIETDMNLPGAESIVRQFLYGLDYYRNTLGVKNNSLFLPDTFGYPRFLPQIAQGFDLDHLIGMRVNTDEIDEHIIYRWKGIDGTEILVNGLSTPAWEYPFVDAVHDYKISNPEHYTTYNAPDPGPRRLQGTYNQFKDKEATNNQIMLIGWGDGGGGGTEDQLELKRKASKLPSFPKVEWTNMYDYITEQQKNYSKFAKFDQRILPSRFIQRTFISANGIKSINRIIEQRLRETEALSSMASNYGFDYPHNELKRLWKSLLLHHFHDIITGMAVPEVLENAYETMIGLEKETIKLRNQAFDFMMTKLKTEKNNLVLFNPSGVTLTGVVEISNVKIEKNAILIDENDEVIAYELYDNGIMIDLKEFKPMTFKVLRLQFKLKSKVTSAKKLIATQNSLENELVKIKFTPKGEISSYFDKEENRELVPKEKLWNTFISLTANSDTTLKEQPFNNEATVVMEDQKSNPLKASLNLNIYYKESSIKQIASLEKGSKQLTFKTSIDWKESDRLEVDFPLEFKTTKANHGIQWGAQEVSRSRFRKLDSLKMPYCAHQWADVSDTDYGVSIFDDVRYGYDLKKEGIRLILSYGIRQKTYEELEAIDYTKIGAGEVGGNSFSYAIFPHNGNHKAANVIQKAKAFNTKILAQQSPENLIAESTKHFITGLPENIILQTIKQAESGKGIILRLYETEQRSTTFKANFQNLPSLVEEQNLNEETTSSLKISSEGVCELSFSPFEIKTLRIK